MEIVIAVVVTVLAVALVLGPLLRMRTWLNTSRPPDGRDEPVGGSDFGGGGDFGGDDPGGNDPDGADPDGNDPDGGAGIGGGLR